jgi:hypothetical protein
MRNQFSLLLDWRQFEKDFTPRVRPKTRARTDFPQVLPVSRSFEHLIYECSEGPTVLMRFLIVYPPRGSAYACLGDTVKDDGTVVPWHAYQTDCGYADLFAKELLLAFPTPPSNAHRENGEVVVGVEIRPYDPPGQRVLWTFVSRRQGPPELPPYSGPLL